MKRLAPLYSTGPNTSKGSRAIKRGRGTLGEHESHATAALGPLFADSERRRGTGIRRMRRRYARSYRACKGGGAGEKRHGAKGQVEDHARGTEGTRHET